MNGVGGGMNALQFQKRQFRCTKCESKKRLEGFLKESGAADQMAAQEYKKGFEMVKQRYAARKKEAARGGKRTTTQTTLNFTRTSKKQKTCEDATAEQPVPQQTNETEAAPEEEEMMDHQEEEAEEEKLETNQNNKTPNKTGAGEPLIHSLMNTINEMAKTIAEMKNQIEKQAENQ